METASTKILPRLREKGPKPAERALVKNQSDLFWVSVPVYFLFLPAFWVIFTFEREAEQIKPQWLVKQR
jgi:hypothetical protein